MEDFEKRAIAAEEQIKILRERIEQLEKKQVPAKAETDEAQDLKAKADKEDKEAVEEKTSAFSVSQTRIKELLKKSEPLTTQEKFELVRSVGEECQKDDELFNLLDKKPSIRCYDGFEPSGRMHIAQGILKAINVNKCTKAGCKFTFWVADWFALLNNKMGGDLNKIKVVGEYMIEVWKACGMDMTNVEFIWSSEEINKNSNDYWLKVMDIATRFKLPRIMRCSQIMGRENESDLFTSAMFYPCMQCADIFHLKADICQLGLDQRKVNMLAREYCDMKKIKLKPIILSHHMLAGLQAGQEKMSKSKPDSAIFMEDEPQDVVKKLRSAFCPPGIVEKNPCIDYIKHIVFQRFDSFTVLAGEKGNLQPKTYTSFEDFVEDYKQNIVFPSEVKTALADAINQLLDPVRKHFKEDPKAKALLDKVKQYKTTR
eukprot:TRINITY_DN1099_c0_g3_i1.p1 TRINITY_DN1099_c0_g3~~TRINITY_DN1099_c0_g3_i1.p1  ORF type:complete len:428 (+),score=143.35 TRINITY_DN1099_c0_g3_i1:59-1342(+)